MLNIIQCHINNCFYFLSKRFGFIKSDEKFDEDYYEVKFQTHEVIIRLEKYRREFYIYLSKYPENNEEINLFSLVEFFNRSNKKNIQSNYFSNVNKLEECYRMQIEWLSNVLKMYLPDIIDFFSDTLYRQNFSTISNYLINKYPDLYVKL